MRRTHCSVLLTLALAVLLSASSGSHALRTEKLLAHPRKHHRKSFGPRLPHARYLHSASHARSGLVGLQQLSVGAFTAASSKQPKDIAVHFLADQAGVPVDQIRVMSMHTAPHSGISHVYLRQFAHGVQITNADSNVNIDRFGRVISFGEALYRGAPPKAAQKSYHKSVLQLLDQTENQISFSKVSGSANPSSAMLSPVQGFAALLEHLELPANPSTLTLQADFASTSTTSDSVFHGTIPKQAFTESAVPVTMAWIQTPQGIKLSYEYEVEMRDNWYHAHVCAHSGQVLSVIDWVADATYEVFPIGVNDPEDGERAVIIDPFSSTASPSGWNSKHKTRGNNVIAMENRDAPAELNAITSLKKHSDNGKANDKETQGHHLPNGGKNDKFRFPLDLTKGPETYIDAAVTQLFYTNNMLHDLFHAYGFSEAAGNFQVENFERGGLPNDPVIAYAQDGSGFNNANFATPPDGKSGRMRMYVWNTRKPYRDGDLENGIIIHEFGHGVSTRLTGGPHNSGCLAWGEAGGMGEGWGDTWATILRMRSAKLAKREYAQQHPWEMGKYANGGNGIRKYPYTPDMKINPSTYSILNQPGYWGVHAKGEVWAMILLEVFWNLNDALGYTPNWRSASTDVGNTLFLQLIVDGLKLQPCRPSFIDARDAILQAEEVLTQGQHACAIWRGFAKRGLGIDAKRLPGQSPWDDDRRVDGFAVPEECQ